MLASGSPPRRGARHYLATWRGPFFFAFGRPRRQGNELLHLGAAPKHEHAAPLCPPRALPRRHGRGAPRAGDAGSSTTVAPFCYLRPPTCGSTPPRCLRLGAGRSPRYRGRLALCAVSPGPCEVPSGAALPTSSTLLRRRVSRLLGAPLAEWRLHTVASSMAPEVALESFYGMFGMLRVHLVQVYEAEIPNWARRQKSTRSTTEF